MKPDRFINLRAVMICIAILVIAGCSPLFNGSHVNPKMGMISDNIDSSADKIKNETKSIGKKVPGKVDGEIQRIDNEADNIKDQTSDLRKLGKDVEKLQKQNAKLKEEANSSNKTAMMYMLLFGVAGIGLSVMMIVNGNAKGIGIGGGAIAIIVTCLTISYLSKPLAYVGGLGILVVIGLIVYKIIEERKKDKAAKEKDSANLELTHTVEAVKEKLPEEAKIELFGTKTIPGHVSNIQSPSTQSIVHGHRVSLRDKFEPTIKK